jgi:hypothetical protein
LFQSATNYAGAPGCFVDHLLPADWSKDKIGTTLDHPFFNALRYKEVLFHRVRREIRLLAVGTFGDRAQEVALNKNYIFSDTSIQVQYILTNRSDTALEGIFASESSYAIPRNEITLEKVTVHSQGVTCVQVTDKAHNVSLLTEPNEAAGFLIATPELGTATFHYWQFKLPPGRQMEKTITMTINTPKKKGKM